jgi:hypothetical protein
MTTAWRATGPYVASSALFSGILDETQLFLQTYAEQSGSLETRIGSAKQALVGGLLPQRSRSSRISIIRRIQNRLTNWGPPAWVLDELAVFAGQASKLALKAALLVHVCRQDRLLYCLVQALIVLQWQEGPRQITNADVHRFLDDERSRHPEIDTWSRQTRDRLGSTTLAILRDYGLLQGKVRKQSVEPIVPDAAANHLARLLRAEGVVEAGIPSHPDWRLWLWDEARARHALSRDTSGG